MINQSTLSQEWCTLQNHHEQHERNAIVIKLVCLSLCLVGVAALVPTPWLGLTIALLWALEAIVKTYQSRLADRLLKVEALLQLASPTGAAMQLHTEWAVQRPGAAGLVVSYALSALKPTVAFPYVPLILAVIFLNV